MRTLMLVGSLILLPSCERGGPVTDCAAWRPMLPRLADSDTPPSRAATEGFDVLTTETARAILAHNLTGRRLCGW